MNSHHGQNSTHAGGSGRGARFNVLLTEDRPRTEAEAHWTNQLGRLLQPQGVTAFVARSAQEAVGLAEKMEFHAAVIDLATPRAAAQSSLKADSELWLVELMRRLPNRPPMVVLRNPAFSQRQADRLLRDLLHLGAFSVLVKPIALEQLLVVFQRLVDRQYKGLWPPHNPTGPPPQKSNN